VEHLIISLEGYYSFSRKGEIKRLEKSKKYVPGYLEVERIQKETRRIGNDILACPRFFRFFIAKFKIT
ncbi:MAG: hypothetical protein JSV88_14685, partial [Candidatus Aminicenantes bacterium]